MRKLIILLALCISVNTYAQKYGYLVVIEKQKSINSLKLRNVKLAQSVYDASFKDIPIDLDEYFKKHHILHVVTNENGCIVRFGMEKCILKKRKNGKYKYVSIKYWKKK